MKPIKIGGSYYIIIPSEFIKVFHLSENEYDVEVSEEGNKILFTKSNIDRVDKEVKNDR